MIQKEYDTLIRSTSPLSGSWDQYGHHIPSKVPHIPPRFSSDGSRDSFINSPAAHADIPPESSPISIKSYFRNTIREFANF